MLVLWWPSHSQTKPETKESFCEGVIHLGLGRLQWVWDRPVIHLSQRSKVVARLSRSQQQDFLLNSAATSCLVVGLWRWAWWKMVDEDECPNGTEELALKLVPDDAYVMTAVDMFGPCLCHCSSEGMTCFHRLTCAHTNRWHQWNRNAKLYANFSGEEGAGNFLLHGYRLFYEWGIDYILLSLL